MIWSIKIDWQSLSSRHSTVLIRSKNNKDVWSVYWLVCSMPSFWNSALSDAVKQCNFKAVVFSTQQTVCTCSLCRLHSLILINSFALLIISRRVFFFFYCLSVYVIYLMLVSLRTFCTYEHKTHDACRIQTTQSITSVSPITCDELENHRESISAS